MRISIFLNINYVSGELYCDRLIVQRGKHQILGDRLVWSLQTFTSPKDMLKWY